MQEGIDTGLIWALSGMAALLFGLAYNALTDYAIRLGYAEGYMAGIVAGGVAGTLLISLIPACALELSGAWAIGGVLFVFFWAGLPMGAGGWLRNARKRRRELELIANGD